MQQQTTGEWATLSRRWRPALMSFFLRRVRDHAAAEDLTQDVFVRLLNGGAEARSPDAYVFQVAANLLTDRARRAKVREDYRQTLANLEDLGVEPLDPHRVATGRAQVALLVSTLGDMPERTRTIFILYRLENLSQETIAESYGITVSAVKKQIAKAMALLMARLREVR